MEEKITRFQYQVSRFLLNNTVVTLIFLAKQLTLLNSECFPIIRKPNSIFFIWWRFWMKVFTKTSTWNNLKFNCKCILTSIGRLRLIEIEIDLSNVKKKIHKRGTSYNYEKNCIWLIQIKQIIYLSLIRYTWFRTWDFLRVIQKFILSKIVDFSR